MIQYSLNHLAYFEGEGGREKKRAFCASCNSEILCEYSTVSGSIHTEG